MTTVVNYGAGNIQSVRNTLSVLGAEFQVTDNPSTVASATKLILPGVGHFGQMLRALDELKLRQTLIEKMRTGTPLLGICVGLQCLFEGSEESPESQGLAIFPGRVRRFAGDIRIPHMGWNSLDSVRPSRLLAGLSPQPFTYFAHSFYAPVIEATAVTCTYLYPYSAILEHENIYAVQFHPEKSGAVGLRVLQNFLSL